MALLTKVAVVVDRIVHRSVGGCGQICPKDARQHKHNAGESGLQQRQQRLRQLVKLHRADFELELEFEYPLAFATGRYPPGLLPHLG